MKTRAATTNKNFSLRRVCFTTAALLPLVSACSTDNFSGSWFGTSSEETAIISSPSASVGNNDRKIDADVNQAACGMFFGQINPKEFKQVANTEISLDRSPQENLMQAIAFDIDGQYENARKLYVWLTASPPENKVNLDCGRGVRLSGNINTLAQRRLVVLDAAAPQYARSSEIETVVAAATVLPGPDLPDPPQVERDRRFYETGGVVVAEPEDSIKPIERMEMKVSENTAQLTMVQSRNSRPAPSAGPGIAAQPVEKPETKSDSAPVVETPTIAGTASNVEYQGAVVASNSRPQEQGEMDVPDRTPTSSMIELPMASQAGNQTYASPQNAALQSKLATTPPVMTRATNTPYYAVQLAAYRSRERAESAWETFRSSSRGVLNNAPHEVISIAIEGKGLFFRLLTGQYATKSDAAAHCKQLQSVGVDCLTRRVTP